LLDDLKSIISQELLRKKILVINAQNSKRRGIEYGPGFNFLIGGNTLGRGIAIPNLLVTYYVRSAKTSQIDTMHQHARM
ncbi:Z1 domain-containing protein, partial [Rhizobium leguminosarum]|uniref:Z1 domain-containing protein n=1 Tax=Rhizobium leguminosarum TaxID=384 RepID=UPI003F9871DF